MFQEKANRRIRGMHPLTMLLRRNLGGNRKERRADERTTHEGSNENHTNNYF